MEQISEETAHKLLKLIVTKYSDIFNDKTMFMNLREETIKKTYKNWKDCDLIKQSKKDEMRFKKTFISDEMIKDFLDVINSSNSKALPDIKSELFLLGYEIK